MKGYIIFVIFFFVFTVSGCAAVDRPPIFITGHDLALADLRMVNGKTTMEDIVRWLGEPETKGTDNLGQEKWIYFSSGIESSETTLDVTFKDGVVIGRTLDSSIDRAPKIP